MAFSARTSVMRFRSVPEGYDPTDRLSVASYLDERHAMGEIVTGLLYANEDVPDIHELNRTPDEPLVSIPYDKLCPGSDALAKFQESYR